MKTEVQLLRSKSTIGLLGGSFNPAHGGHLHITLHALKSLGLDEIWWLVSPHNPLKSPSSLAAYQERLASAQAVAARHRHIRVLDIEARQGLYYSIDTVRWLQAHYPRAHFVWLMGADNLAQFHRWRRWQELLRRLPIAVFDRAPYSHTALRSKTFLRQWKFRKPGNQQIVQATPPAIAFIHLKRDPMSSTALRSS
ncbi:MAG: nicotinate (nicotinamide) nucleotide adenylyltransferase [Pseudomonadota bacterium]|nr:nicotinate (nicotinamide) nucleotide adenylyltransferase [Pseudomonadota bacterium]